MGKNLYILRSVSCQLELRFDTRLNHVRTDLREFLMNCYRKSPYCTTVQFAAVRRDITLPKFYHSKILNYFELQKLPFWADNCQT